jgi:hypothetical protein
MALRSIVPELVSDPKDRARIEYFQKSYQAWKHEPVDQLNHLGLILADIAGGVFAGVADPGNAQAVKAFLEKTPIQSVQTARYSPDSHIALKAANIAVVEYKGGHWTKADPLK